MHENNKTEKRRGKFLRRLQTQYIANKLIIQGSTLLGFSIFNPVRLFLLNVLKHPYFDNASY